MFALLPLAQVMTAALQMQSPQLVNEDLGEQLTEGVKARLADGWLLVDVRGDYDELSLTVEKAGKVEQHVIHTDYTAKNAAYRIDVIDKVPADRIAPSPFMVTALSGNGGVEVGGDCGRIEARPYMLEASAKGAEAAKLVSKTLKASTDLENARVYSDFATFTIDLKKQATEIHVVLESSLVVAAQVRSYEYGPDMSTHKKHSKMRKSLPASVTSIEEGTDGPILVGARRYAVDLTALRLHFPDDHTCGC